MTVYGPVRTPVRSASFVALSPDHPLTESLAAASILGLQPSSTNAARAGTSEAEIETAEKLIFDSGLKVAHPFDPAWQVPVWIGNFVLMEYGTGAIYGCPAHDQRDLDFARKYRLPVTPVVLPPDADPATFAVGDEAYVGSGRIYNSGFMDGHGGRGGQGPPRHRQCRGAGAGRRARRCTVCATGASPVSAAGAARPGSALHQACGVVALPEIGPAGHPAGRHGLQQTGQCAGAAPNLEAHHLPGLRRARQARPGHARHVRRFRVVLRPLRRPDRRGR